jgi:hypothetical protein
MRIIDSYLLSISLCVVTTSVFSQNGLKKEGDLQCVAGGKEGEKICQGKSPEYIKSEEQIQKSMGGLLGLRSGVGGLSIEPVSAKRPQCGADNSRSYGSDGGYGSYGGCQLLQVDFMPTVLYNRNGYQRYILQINPFEQKVYLGICGNDRCGGGYGYCNQRHQSVQLIGWDPNNVSAGLLVEQFNLPTCCSCSSDWYGGNRQQTNVRPRGNQPGRNSGSIQFDGPVTK